MKGTAKAVRMLVDAVERNDTQFDTRIADITTSLSDLPSTYPVNNERYELKTEGTIDSTGTVDDTDATNKIDDNDNFTDQPGRFDLATNGTEGDAIELRGRKRLTYQPNYELLWGAAYYMQSALNDGHRLDVAFKSPDRQNGYFIRIESDLQESFIRTGGVDIDRAEWGERHDTTNPYEDGFDETQPQVVRQYLSWYGDGAARTELNHGNEGGFVNTDTVARVANTDSVATEEINLQITARLECIADAPAQTLSCLSFGGLNRGPGSASNRTKTAVNWGLGNDSIDSTAYTPILAVRRRPGFEQVPTLLGSIEIIPSDRMEVLSVGFNENATGLDATGWDIPPQMDAENTATEQTTNVSTFPTDVDGNPAGRQLGAVVAAGTGGNRADRAQADVQKEFYENEVVVYLAKTKTASNASVDLVWQTIQEW